MNVLLPRAKILPKVLNLSTSWPAQALSLLAPRNQISIRFVSTNTMAQEFPPEKVRAVVSEVATLLKEKKETVSVAETVRLRVSFCYSGH
jgi:hypothetical protein